jgi:hypothetical protein
MLPSFRSLINLVESILLENVVLSKGGQQVIKNVEMVAGLAKRVRRDSRMNPQNFPAGFSAKAEKLPDQQVAEWFLEQLDKIERAGYEGVQYSRDGANHQWIAAKYIIGAHNWEDITGTMGMNLSKYYFLKNRNMLDPAHANIPAFRSIRDIGEYMVYHYQQALEEYDAKMKAAAMRKQVRAFLIVDNDDYKIYTTLNRVANVLMGQGTTWCTSSSNYGDHFHSYSKSGMLFQMFPYDPEEVELTRADNRQVTGKERYQFDVGGPNFMNIADRPPSKEYIKEKYPYLYDDLVNGLRSKKAEIEEYTKTASEDPNLQTTDTKVKEYNVDEEIAKLRRFIQSGWMTTARRPKPPAPEETPELPPEQS